MPNLGLGLGVRSRRWGDWWVRCEGLGGRAACHRGTPVRHLQRRLPGGRQGINRYGGAGCEHAAQTEWAV
jgi:hypothetical protein